MKNVFGVVKELNTQKELVTNKVQKCLELINSIASVNNVDGISRNELGLLKAEAINHLSQLINVILDNPYQDRYVFIGTDSGTLFYFAVRGEAFLVIQYEDIMIRHSYITDPSEILLNISRAKKVMNKKVSKLTL